MNAYSYLEQNKDIVIQYYDAHGFKPAKKYFYCSVDTLSLFLRNYAKELFGPWKELNISREDFLHICKTKTKDEFIAYFGIDNKTYRNWEKLYGLKVKRKSNAITTLRKDMILALYPKYTMDAIGELLDVSRQYISFIYEKKEDKNEEKD